MLEYLKQFEALPEDQRVLEEVIIVDKQGKEQVIAKGFTVTVVHQDTSQKNGEGHTHHEWTERRFITLSPEYAQKQQEQLEKQIEKTEKALGQLVKRRRGYQYPESVSELAEKVSGILAVHGCEAYLKVDITEEIECKQIRKYKNRPAREEKRTNFHLQIIRQEEDLAKKQRLMGWRAYATNAPEEKLSLSKAVDVYRDAYLHEHGYSRLKGKPLSLTPMYLHKEDQITGLIRLLSLALRVLTLIEFVVRKRLAEEGSHLKGVYAGNRNRKTKTPRTETLLEVFKGIILTIIHTGEKEWIHLNPLTATQKHILQLLGMTEEVYMSLVPEFSKVIFKSAN
jgi:transposase